MKLFFKIILLLVSTTVSAHSPSQINYVFSQSNEGPELVVHFTPYAAMQLLEYKKPELKEQSIVRLADYNAFFTKYFNETVDLKINGVSAKFNFVDSDLVSHDAKLFFTISNVIKLEGTAEINITSYTEVFNKLKNFVTFLESDDKQSIILNKSKTKASFELKGIRKTGLADVPNYIWIGGGLLLIVSILLTIKLIFFKK